MIRIMSQGDTTEYGNVTYVADTEADLATIDTNNCSMGSACIIIETSSVFMLDSENQWREI